MSSRGRESSKRSTEKAAGAGDGGVPAEEAKKKARREDFKKQSLELSAAPVASDEPLVQEFVDFVNASPSAFHAVAAAEAMLEEAGFQQILETDDSQFNSNHEEGGIVPEGKYYFTRNQSTIVAFAVGRQWKPGNGFSIVAAHTDSPCPKLKPISRRSAQGYLQVGLQQYGGGLWYTWFDRDLSVAGRVVVADTADEDCREFTGRLVRVRRPLLRIPSLAIHLNRSVNESGFQLNAEDNFHAVLATEVKAALESGSGTESSEKKEQPPRPPQSTLEKHHPLLIRILAKELGVEPSQIRNFELSLYDTQPSVVGGALNEFIFSPRLDNLMMSFCAIKALINSLHDGSLHKEQNIRMACLFDNEEIGSQSHRGAASNLLSSVMTRLSGAVNVNNAIALSMLVSADMAHAVHPNYAAKHEDQHRPQMHKGLVVKHNANQRYATTDVSAFFLQELARRHKISLQEFVVRNDVPCGTTIGPILSANCGIRTVDVGIPQLAMHSCREMCGTGDVATSVELFTHFYREFPMLDESVTQD